MNYNDFVTHIANELEYQIEMGIEWRLSQEVGRIFKYKERPWRIKINLYGVKKAFSTTIYDEHININYVAKFLVEYLHIMKPILDEREQKKCSVYMPILQDKCVVAKKGCFTMAEAECMFHALKYILENHVLSHEQRVWTENKIQELVLYQELPEIIYEKSSIPQYGLLWLLQNQRMLDMTIPQLFDSYLSTGNELHGGSALRLIVYMEENQQHLFMENEKVRKGFERVANVYRDKSVKFVEASSGFESKLLRDNRYAVEETVKRINRMMSKYDVECNSGTIHPLGL